MTEQPPTYCPYCGSSGLTNPHWTACWPGYHRKCNECGVAFDVKIDEDETEKREDSDDD